MSKVIQVVISDDEYKAIIKEAENQGRKVSQMARRLMIDSLKPRADINYIEMGAVSKRNS